MSDFLMDYESYIQKRLLFIIIPKLLASDEVSQFRERSFKYCSIIITSSSFIYNNYVN